MRRAAAGVAALVLAACASCTSSQPADPGSPATKTTAKTTAARSGQASVAPPPAPAAKRTVTILGSGDVLIHPALWMQARRDAKAEGRTGYDFGPMYASVAPDTSSADLSICEMETPLAPPQGPFVGYPDFNAPPQVLTALTGVGYDSCTTASNHSLDQGYDGVKRTLDEVDAAGLRHTGSARSAAEAAKPMIITMRNGVKVGQLAYAFGFNGIQKPADKPWLANEIDVPSIITAAKAEKAAGADIVVLSLHWGTEYDHLATETQLDQAGRLMKSPYIDVILGAHVHVVQPARKMHGKWVFFGMGNQISRHANPIAVGRQGVMPRVTFTEDTPGHFVTSKAEAIPTWMEDEPKLRLIDLPRALASSTPTPAQRTEYLAAHRAIVSYLSPYGAVRDGLVIR